MTTHYPPTNGKASLKQVCDKIDWVHQAQQRFEDKMERQLGLIAKRIDGQGWRIMKIGSLSGGLGAALAFIATKLF